MKFTMKPANLLLLFIVVLTVAGGTGLLLTGCSRDHTESANKEKTLYTCGMHPQIIQDKSGNCPICGMKLTPVRKQPGTNAESGAAGAMRTIKFYKSSMNPGEISQKPGKDTMGMDMVPVYESDGGGDSAIISIDPVTVQNMGFRSAIVARGPVRRTIRTVGVIDFDETTLADVTTKFRGWIEKLYADSTGKQLHRGDPLFEIYSPELYSAQTEYLLALSQSSGADSMKGSALNKLTFFDIPAEQIAELEKTRQVKKTLRINAPRDGIVVEKMAVEGQLVEAGMKLYRLADLSLVWVQSQVYENDLALIQLGQEAEMTLTYLPDRKFRGRVTYIYPTVDEKTRTAKVRMEFHNPGYLLKPGMFATVELHAEIEADALLVPDMAVLRSGEKNTAFVALDGGKFDPRTLVLGPRSENNSYQVISGLNEGERVVTSGQFMLDSESQLREAIQKMLKPGTLANQEAAGHSEHQQRTDHSQTVDSTDGVYICPMPEHLAIQYAHSSKCPLCGMTLVPVSRQLLSRIQPGGKLEYYTCPMPEHADVRSPAPGKCARCGMTMIPIMTAPPLIQPDAANAKPSHEAQQHDH
jgi:Cu(I)/Ag(I) efflux system membrane fusion protein